MQEIKKKAFMGVAWSSGSFIFSQLASLFVKLVLIRLLIPEEFGLVAMAAIVLSSLSLLNALSGQGAFVRDYESDPKRAKNTLFWTNGTAHVLIALIGFISAPYVAGFFAHRISDAHSIITLTWIIRAFALNHFITPFIVVPNAVLGKELRFREKVIAGISGTTTYLIITTALAFLGFGVWAIVIGQISNQIIMRTIKFSYAPFFPSLIFDKGIFKKYAVFSANNFIGTLTGIGITNVDDTLIGRILGPAVLGFYSLGAHFAGLISSLISGTIMGVAYPLLSKMQDDRETYSKTFFKIFRLTSLFTIPAIGGAVILANEIVILIMGEKWVSIIPIFYILAVGSFLGNTVRLAGPVLNSLNKPQILRNNNLIQFGFFIVLIYPFIQIWGILGVCAVFVIFPIVSIIHLLPHLSKEIPNLYSYIFKTLSKIIPITLIMMAIVYYIKQFLVVNLFWLFALVFIGIIVYFIPMWFLDPDIKWDAQESWRVIKEKYYDFRARFRKKPPENQKPL